MDKDEEYELEKPSFNMDETAMDSARYRNSFTPILEKSGEIVELIEPQHLDIATPIKEEY